jgi:hypothetical protein
MSSDLNVVGHLVHCLLIAGTILLSALEVAGQTTNIWTSMGTGCGITPRIYFGTTTSGLTTNQLANVRWQDPFGSGSGLVMGAVIESDGRIRPAPVPELTSIVGFGILACICTFTSVVE